MTKLEMMWLDSCPADEDERAALYRLVKLGREAFVRAADVPNPPSVQRLVDALGDALPEPLRTRMDAHVWEWMAASVPADPVPPPDWPDEWPEDRWWEAELS
jgi:hypothetical protein